MNEDVLPIAHGDFPVSHVRFLGYITIDCVSPVTLPETDIARESGWLEDEFPLGPGLFSGAMLNLGSVVNHSAKSLRHPC